MAGIVRLAVGLLVLGLVGMGCWLGATRWHPASARYPLQGIDLPLDPPPVDWGTVRGQGADFAYLTATAGTHRRGATFEANWDALPEAGLRRGAVHLYSLCEPATAQANAFNVVVPRDGDALPAAVDIAYRDDCAERPDRAAVQAGLAEFVRTVETHTGKPVLLRVSRSVDADYALTGMIDRPIWAMGNWFAPRYPAKQWRIWRATDVRRIDGVDGPVNWDVVAS